MAYTLKQAYEENRAEIPKANLAQIRITQYFQLYGRDSPISIRVRRSPFSIDTAPVLRL